jgi:hypothetical protein
MVEISWLTRSYIGDSVLDDIVLMNEVLQTDVLNLLSDILVNFVPPEAITRNLMSLFYQFRPEGDAEERGNGLFEAGIGGLVVEVVDAVHQELLRLFLPVVDQAALVRFPDLVVRRRGG